MANELIQFDNLRAVLEEFAQEFKDQYRAGLLAHDRITRDGHQLVDSVDANTVQAMIREGDEAWTVTINLMEYWKYVEEGVQGTKNPGSPYRNPGWKAYPHILNWVEIKPVLPRPNSRGVRPSNRSLAYLITREIAGDHPRHPTKDNKAPGGTRGSHDFKTAQETTIERFRVRIRVAMIKDVQNYVRQVLARK